MENRKSEYRHLILHYIGLLEPNLKLKLTILIFWIKFAQKGYFRCKTETLQFSHVPMVVTYCIKLFRTDANGHNAILMSLLLLVAGKKT